MSSCLAVATAVAALVLFVWYPWPYRIVSGGEDLLFLVMTVDVIMGPLITFAIFDIRKPLKELRRDLAIIVIFQLIALGGGLFTVFMARPAVLALEVDRFRVTTAVDVAVQEFPQAQPGFQSLSLTGPRLVTVALPTQEQKYDAIMAGMGGLDLGSRPMFWRAWGPEARQQTLKVGKSVAPLMATATDALREAVARTGKPADQLLYLPMLARRNDWSVLVDKTSGDPVGFAPIDTN
ncbi:TfpX/TfpZ family type IV pilin accessory protein [Roseateles sp. L2-2]|uniref:TfpX/TfpZ family type IV pilin accessory protein n=1 Tax=Roseateles TaxID=93681 RepID=UPI003D36FB4B